MGSTPLRSLGVEPGPDGVTVLRTPRVTRTETADREVLEILRAAGDVGSGSAELLAAAVGPAARHLSPQRRGILEFVEIPAGVRVLEIGPGCGPITRLLGERGGIVDAVEGGSTRAAATRERCRDLAEVQVFVGELADVPDEPAYDLVVVVGVLEWIADGAADPGPYREFLAGLSRRLLPGGQLLLAIENQLGVKYFAGALEDHTERIFDGLEGYPHSPEADGARTFSRSVLTGLLTSAGFEVDRVLAAFPDHRMTRAVLDPAIERLDASLAYRIPQFPSPDPVLPRPRLVDEYRLWRTFVEAGLTAEFGNSFLVCARLPGARPTLWPEGRYAGFATLVRGPGLAARTVVQDGPDGPELDRRYLGESDDPGLRVLGGRSALLPGRDLLDVLAAADDQQVAELLRRWVELVGGMDFAAGAPVDAVPHNVLLHDDELRLIDDEFRVDDWDLAAVLTRGLYWTAVKLAPRITPQRWPELVTVRDLAEKLKLASGVDTPDGWLDGTVAREAALQARVIPSLPEAELRERLGQNLDGLLVQVGLGERAWSLRGLDLAGVDALIADRDRSLAAASAAEQETTRVELERRSLESRLASEGERTRSELDRVEKERRHLEADVLRVEGERRHLEQELHRVEGERLTQERELASLRPQVTQFAEMQQRLAVAEDDADFLREQLEQTTMRLRGVLGRKAYRWSSAIADTVHRVTARDR